MQYTINLLAGVEQRQEFNGTVLLLVDTGSAASIDIKVELDGNLPIEELRGMRRGLRLRTPGFKSARFLSAVNTTIEVVVTRADIAININDGAEVTATVANLPLPVSNDRGAPANPVYVSGLTYSDAPATAVNNLAAVAVTDAGAALLAADANRKAARFCNIGTDPVAIGGTGITWATRAIVLSPGDVWVEERASNVAWAAITDTGLTASVTIQEVMA